MHSSFRKLGLAALARAAAILLAASAGGAAPSDPAQTLENPAPAADDQFGTTVELAGGKALVGAPLNNFVFPDSGTVYVFETTSGTLERTINDPNPATGDQFGASMAAVGANVLIGAPMANSGSGAAYLYDPATGARLMTMTDPPAQAGEAFGFSVAAFGSDFLIGAPFTHLAGAPAGAVYWMDGTTPTVKRAFHNPLPEIDDEFGFAVVAFAGKVIIGGPYVDHNGHVDEGCAYVFDPNSGDLEATLTDPHAMAGDHFGYAIAATGDRLIIGAPGDSTGAINAGVAYVYDSTASLPILTLLNPTPELFAQADSFGSSIRAAGRFALIGANGDDFGVADTGSAYLMSLVTGRSNLDYHDPAATMFDRFGNAVAYDGQRVLIGAFMDDTGASNAGRAYLYGAPSPSPEEVVDYLLARHSDPSGLDLNSDGVIDAADVVQAARQNPATAAAKTGGR